MKKIFFAFFLMSMPHLMALHAADARGKLTYLEGTIELYKNGEVLDKKDIDKGCELEEYDLIKTGDNGYAEIAINSLLSDTIFIKMKNNSVFYFTSDNIMSGNEASLKVLEGSINVKVKKLLSDEKLTLVSRNTLVGVRGTEFSVTTAPEGSILVTCPEGSVLCRIQDGTEAAAGGGNVVEVLQGRQIKSIDIGSGTSELYANEWYAERVRVFRSGSFSLTKPIILQYEEHAERFNLYYKELKDLDKIISRHSTGSEEIDADSAAEDKIRISPVILNMRKLFFNLEELFYRIDEIQRYHAVVPVKGALRKKYDIDDFMKDFHKNYKNMSKKTAYTRQAFRIYYRMDYPGRTTPPVEVIPEQHPLPN